MVLNSDFFVLCLPGLDSRSPSREREVSVFRFLLLLVLLGTVAWCVVVAPSREPDLGVPPAPSLSEPITDSLDEGLRRTGVRFKERAIHGLKQTGHRLEEAGSEANEWLLKKTDDAVDVVYDLKRKAQKAQSR